jgi:hypothetical protein
MIYAGDVTDASILGRPLLSRLVYLIKAMG